MADHANTTLAPRARSSSRKQDKPKPSLFTPRPPNPDGVLSRPMCREGCNPCRVVCGVVMSFALYWAKEADRLAALEPLETDDDHAEWQALFDRAAGNASDHIAEFRQERATSLAQAGRQAWQRHDAAEGVQ